MSDKVLIMIPAYKRHESLALCLSSLSTATEKDLFEIDVAIGINAPVEENKLVVEDVKSRFESGTYKVRWRLYDRNIGKAEALNDLLATFWENHRYVLSMDSDMVIKKPWVNMLPYLDEMDYDIVGFGGTRFWSHSPNVNGEYQQAGPYRIYRRPNISGALMLYSHKFLKDHKFGGYGGVYGGVDGYSCTLTDKKYVLFWDEDWIEHDTLKDSTPALRDYENHKRAFFTQKIWSFPEGWDEMDISSIGK